MTRRPGAVPGLSSGRVTVTVVADDNGTDDARWGGPGRDQPTQPWAQPSPTVPLDPWAPPPAAQPEPTQPYPAQPAWGTPPSAPPSSAPQPYTVPEAYGQPPQYGTAPQYGYGMPPDGSPPPNRSAATAWVLGIVMALVAAVGIGGGGWYLLTQRSASSALPAASTSSEVQEQPLDPSQAPDPSPADPGMSAGPTGRAVPGPTATGSVRAWLAASNAYCRKTLDPAVKRLLPLAEVDPVLFLTRFAAVNRQADAYLRKAPPSSLAADVKAMTGHWDDLAAHLDKAAVAFRAGDTDTAQQEWDLGQVANQKGNAIANRIGLPDCAEAGGIGVSKSPSPSGLTI